MKVPRLRFKDDGGYYPDWQKGSLLELSESGFTNGVFNDPAKVGRGYKLINVLDMYIESTIDEKRLFLVELSESEFEKNKAEYGDIFFTRSSLVKEGIAFSNVYLGCSQDVTFDGHLIKMSPRKDLINPIFFNYVLRTSEVRKQLVMRGKTATMTTIGQADIATVNVIFPLLPEQTKIANFLTAIDEKITQLTQKYDLLKQYKKGVMQQIFSQKLRFKDEDGREFAEWEESTLENIATFLRGGNLSKSNISVDGKFECIHYGELFTIYSEVIRTVKSKTNLTDAVRSLSGDILMPSSDVTPLGLAKASCVLKAGIILGGDINIIRVNNKINSIFMSYLLNFEKNKIIQLVSGTTVKHIYIKDIKAISLTIPQNEEEQTKIANFLTAIDDKIAHTQTQLNAVKLYKKGLLQQMFV